MALTRSDVARRSKPDLGTAFFQVQPALILLRQPVVGQLHP
jgi:hypothetical protein